MRKFLSCVFAAVSAAALAEVRQDSASDAAFVVLKPRQTLSWGAIPPGRVTLPVPHPPGAAKLAALTVEGFRYRRTIGNITGDAVELDIPAPVAGRSETENLYTFRLEFSDGSERIARVATIDDYSGGNEGSTRCISPATSSAWGLVRRLAVMPLPEDADAITVNGIEHDAGEGCLSRWFMIDAIKPGDSFALESGGCAAALEGYTLGSMLFVR